eukprot:354080-Chlamydomonas_euryale.AAC.6
MSLQALMGPTATAAAAASVASSPFMPPAARGPGAGGGAPFRWKVTPETFFEFGHSFIAPAAAAAAAGVEAEAEAGWLVAIPGVIGHWVSQCIWRCVGQRPDVSKIPAVAPTPLPIDPACVEECL